MDKETRNRIQKATQAARALLEQEFAEQLEGVFDVRLDGTIAVEAGVHLDAPQRIVRTKLVAAIGHLRASGHTTQGEAVAAYLREAAFTTLNRFVALKMLEARGLVQECISRGEQSSGFKEFCGLAPGLVQLPDHGYRLYIESLFDELSVHVRVLFNRRDASSLLWPKRATIDRLLDVLNDRELAGVWGEDETIGWVYQYYNDEAERKRMREESAAPRNSRELAVRNQFFTPRYVVEFLADNTLGRIWYEMTQGRTRLKEQCRYLVRRPTEIFLKPAEPAPEGFGESEAKASETLSQEELLRQPVYIPHRPLKDPREIRLLDPACGSMHFGLYAFDLFLTIYDEAWDLDLLSPSSGVAGGEGLQPLRDLYPTKEEYLLDIPRLIIEHNLHGIDIDRRAVQIAGLSLWLRAQRAWHQAGVNPADRPRIRRSNIVCAEPMPGEKELLRDFVDQQFPAHERPAFAFLLERVFDRMTLAGEAGSLLRIEEEIRDAITEARALAREQAAPRQLQLLPGDAAPEQTRLDLSGLTDQQFWEAAEQRIYEALRAYADQTENGSGFRRRLFADDAAQGFAFIDLCRKRYDVVVMNPPFGEATRSLREFLTSNFPNTKHDLYAAFTERALTQAIENGLVGEISSRVGFFIKSFEKWRTEVMARCRVECIVDLGFGVLDGATVEAACYVVSNNADSAAVTPVARLLTIEDKEHALLSCINDFSDIRWFTLQISKANVLPLAPWIYWVSLVTLRALAGHDSLEPEAAVVRQGLGTGDNNRFIRALWEVPPSLIGSAQSESEEFYEQFDTAKRWSLHVRSGSSQPWYSPLTLVIDWERQGLRLKEHWKHKGESPSRYIPSEELYFRPGFSWTLRAFRLIPYVIPAGCIPSASRYMAFPNPGAEFDVLGFAASNIASAFMRFYGEMFERPKHLVDTLKRLPYVMPTPELRSTFEEVVRKEVAARKFFFRAHEPYQDFVIPSTFEPTTDKGSVRWDGMSFLGRTTELEVAHLLGLTGEQLSELEFDLKEAIQIRKGKDNEKLGNDEEDNDEETACDLSPTGRASDGLSYALGTIFGRWDIRYATGERPAPPLSDPLAPMPACPPGMLQGDDGLPLSPAEGRRQRAEGGYPLDVAWDGILVDDPEHPLDIERRVHDAFAVIWGDRAEAIQQEACELLGVPTLREWFRRPAGFFADHLKRYSKSRRQAPIYWPLSSPGGRYTVWLYYHRFSKDTLYRALEQVQEKLTYEERKLSRLTADAGGNPGAAERAALADQESFVTELRTFRDELTRVAALWNPDLNDGVILNHGPLWRMIGHSPWQKAVKAKWDELVAGKCDWAHLAMHLWPERVVPKCAKDRSLAIGHGVEGVFWEEQSSVVSHQSSAGDTFADDRRPMTDDAKPGKWQPRKVPKSEID